MKKLIITLLAGTFIFFVWNIISWMVLPFHSTSLNTIPESVIEAQQLKHELPEDGIYHYPGLPNNTSPEEIARIEHQLEKGPRITFMAFKSGSTELFEFKTFGINLMLNLLTVCLIFFVVKNQQEKSVKSIVLTTVALGLMIACASDFPQMNWFMFPLEFVLPNVFDHLMSCTLLGLLLGLYTFNEQEAKGGA